MLVVRGLVFVLLLGFPLSIPVWADDCASERQSVTSVRSVAKADLDSIRRLKVGLTVEDLNDWAETTDDKRSAILKRSLLMAGAHLMTFVSDGAAEAATKPMAIAGYPLPNGLASLGTGQANTIIGTLQRSGAAESVSGKALVTAIRMLSQAREKKKLIEILPDISALLTAGFEAQASESFSETAGIAFQLAADLAGQGQVAIAIGRALFHGGSDLWEAYIISLSVTAMSSSNESQLNALRVLAGQLKRHVQALQAAKAKLQACGEQSTSQNATFPTDIGACVTAHKACSLGTYYCAAGRALCEMCIKVRALDREFYPRDKALKNTLEELGKKRNALDGSPANDPARDQYMKQMVEATKELQNVDKEWSDKGLSIWVNGSPSATQPASRGTCDVPTIELWMGSR